MKGEKEMKKQKILRSIICIFVAILVCLPLDGCAAVVAKKIVDEKRNATPAPDKSVGSEKAPAKTEDDTEKGKDDDEKWDISGAINGLAEDFGSSIGAGLDQFSKDIGTSFGNDVQKIGQEKDPADNTPSPTGNPSYKDTLNELDTNELGKIVDTVKEKAGEILDGDGKPAATGTENVDDAVKDSDPVLEGPYHVAYCYDGDTVRIQEWEGVRVRLIGVDTPESVASDEYLEKSGKQNTQEGKDASAFMKEYFPQDKVDQNIVYIERDVEHKDRYDRELVYLYALKDGELVFVNELLLREGLAKLFTLQPNSKYADNKFYEAQKYARENGKGFWGTGFFEEE